MVDLLIDTSGLDPKQVEPIMNLVKNDELLGGGTPIPLSYFEAAQELGIRMNFEQFGEPILLDDGSEIVKYRIKFGRTDTNYHVRNEKRGVDGKTDWLMFDGNMDDAQVESVRQKIWQENRVLQ